MCLAHDPFAFFKHVCVCVFIYIDGHGCPIMHMFAHEYKLSFSEIRTFAISRWPKWLKTFLSILCLDMSIESTLVMIISICKLLEKMFIGLYVLFFLVCIYFHLIDNAFEIFYNLKSKLIDFIVFFIIMFNIWSCRSCNSNFIIVHFN
jgi:hypothetical protein